MSCELVTTGWYASNEVRNYMTHGDDIIRGPEFRPLWWRSLDAFVKPEHVFIVDSASPIKVDDAAYTSTDFQTLKLLMNPGHSQTGKTHYSGWTAGIILGLEFALNNDVDMFLYVEQDVLLYGTGIVDKIKSALRRRDLVFGAGNFVSIQQSLVAANKKGIRRFLSLLHSINYPDKLIAPEQKFMYAASRIVPSPLLAVLQYNPYQKLRVAGLHTFALACSLSKGYEVLPFGYGRHRPINFSDEVFYFQHATADELRQYRKLTGF